MKNDRNPRNWNDNDYIFMLNEYQNLRGDEMVYTESSIVEIFCETIRKMGEHIRLGKNLFRRFSILLLK